MSALDKAREKKRLPMPGRFIKRFLDMIPVVGSAGASYAPAYRKQQRQYGVLCRLYADDYADWRVRLWNPQENESYRKTFHQKLRDLKNILDLHFTTAIQSIHIDM